MNEDKLPVAPAADCWATAEPSPCATAPQNDTASPPSANVERAAGFGAMLSAFLASSWCWLPPLLIVGGISGAGMTTALQTFRPIFMIVAFGCLGLAFYLTYRPQARAGQGGVMAFNKIMLWAASVMVLVFLFCPQYFTFASARGGAFTNDMTRTVITVEGMTCPGWVPTAEKALRTAPGVLAVSVDYESKQATIGTKTGSDVPQAEILAALESIGYRGQIVEK